MSKLDDIITRINNLGKHPSDSTKPIHALWRTGRMTETDMHVACFELFINHKIRHSVSHEAFASTYWQEQFTGKVIKMLKNREPELAEAIGLNNPTQSLLDEKRALCDAVATLAKSCNEAHITNFFIKEGLKVCLTKSLDLATMKTDEVFLFCILCIGTSHALFELLEDEDGCDDECEAVWTHAQQLLYQLQAVELGNV